ncbi:hypothetical protein [Streptomyces sp. YIM 98790]|uniref:hypothetical protein n=1 Tax=Streptomyces sp. YIM 98790 TaxID=2689077 RepID=UPI0014099B6A|nr:hypothetical protein [Streptomyces sp. YIM 98790]
MNGTTVCWYCRTEPADAARGTCAGCRRHGDGRTAARLAAVLSVLLAACAAAVLPALLALRRALEQAASQPVLPGMPADTAGMPVEEYLALREETDRAREAVLAQDAAVMDAVRDTAWPLLLLLVAALALCLAWTGSTRRLAELLSPGRVHDGYPRRLPLSLLPAARLAMPMLTLRGVWRASAPRGAAGRADRGRLLALWAVLWAAGVATGVSGWWQWWEQEGQALGRLARQEPPAVAELEGAVPPLLASSVLLLCWALVGLVCVIRMTRRQRAALAEGPPPAPRERFGAELSGAELVDRFAAHWITDRAGERTPSAASGPGR